MSNPRSRRFWEKFQHQYPHQIEVKHMSLQDINPSEFSAKISNDFLRVPFDGIAHWGFRHESTLAKFKQIAEID